MSKVDRSEIFYGTISAISMWISVIGSHFVQKRAAETFCSTLMLIHLAFVEENAITLYQWRYPWIPAQILRSGLREKLLPCHCRTRSLRRRSSG